tara:strand:+ start:164 stop:337 length:174 start_codon:yes stop_codon:yes gene_type:complete
MCSIDGKNDPSEDETFFEDDPRAAEYNDNEVGKVNIRSMGYVYTESAMASAIRDKLK